jgi:hypothetical protein
VKILCLLSYLSGSHLSLLMLLLFNVSFYSFIVFPRNVRKTSRSIDYIGGLTNVIACPINKRRLDDLFFILFFLSFLATLYKLFPHSTAYIAIQAYILEDRDDWAATIVSVLFLTRCLWPNKKERRENSFFWDGNYHYTRLVEQINRW